MNLPTVLSELAIVFANWGMSVTPVRPRTKSPFIPGWQSRYHSTSQCLSDVFMAEQEGSDSICIRTGLVSHVTVIDVDNKPVFKDRPHDPETNPTGVEVWDRVCAEHDYEPHTFTVLTPSGGRHYYYEYDKRLQTCTNCVLPMSEGPRAAPVDIRNDSGAIMTAGSKHDKIMDPETGDFKRYEVLEGSYVPSSLGTSGSQANKRPVLGKIPEFLVETMQHHGSSPAPQQGAPTAQRQTRFMLPADLSVVPQVHREKIEAKMRELEGRYRLGKAKRDPESGCVNVRIEMVGHNQTCPFGSVYDHQGMHFTCFPDGEKVTLACFGGDASHHRPIVVECPRQSAAGATQIGGITFVRRVLTPENKYINVDDVATPEWLENGGVSFNKGPTGSGKTGTTRRIVDEKFRPEDRVLYLSSRISLALNVRGRLNFESYTDYKREKGTPRATDNVLPEIPRRLIISPESIHKIRQLAPLQGAWGRQAMPKIDLLILDEFRMLLSNLTSKTMSNQRSFGRGELLQMLEDLVRNAKCVLVLDADLDDCAVQFLVKLRHKENDVVIANEYIRRDGNGRQLLRHANLERLLCAAVKALQEGKRIAIPCALQKVAETVRDYIKERCPDKKIVYLDRDTPDETKKQYADVTRMWGPENCDCLIYTSTIGVGIDYSVPIEETFDSLFVIHQLGGPTTHDLFQMMGRIRCLRNPIVHFCVIGAGRKDEAEWLPDTAEAVSELLGRISEQRERFVRLCSQDTQGLDLAYHNETYRALLCETFAERARDINDLDGEFFRRAAWHGYARSGRERAWPTEEGLPIDKKERKAELYCVSIDLEIHEDRNKRNPASEKAIKECDDMCTRFGMERADPGVIKALGGTSAPVYSNWLALENPRESSPLCVSARRALCALARLGGLGREVDAFCNETYGIPWMACLPHGPKDPLEDWNRGTSSGHRGDRSLLHFWLGPS